jgi:cationic amino acid transporter 1
VGDYASSASSTDSVLLEENEDLEEEPELPESPVTTRVALQNPLLSSENPKPAVPTELSKEEARRWAAVLAISGVFAGVVLISLATAAEDIPVLFRWSLGSLGIPVFVAGSTVLCLIDQDEDRHNFGQAGGFHCPWVPLLPIASILVNVYLLVNLGLKTWMRVSIWMVLGVLVYIFYGMRHSQLAAVLLPKPEDDSYSKLAVEPLV